MDRYFYSVEMDGDRKVVHLFGNVYYIVNDAEDCYRLAEWMFFYIDVNELMELVKNDEFYNYINEKVNYLTNMTKEDAVWTCETYYNGDAGKELHIQYVNENTPCGDYWFEYGGLI